MILAAALQYSGMKKSTTVPEDLSPSDARGSERLVAGDLKERLAPLPPDLDKRERELLLVRVISATLQGASDHQG